MSESNSGGGLELWVSRADDPQGGSVVTVIGELDAAGSDRLQEALARALDGQGDVEIDLRGCSFVDSAGIATLVWGALRLQERGRMLILAGARDRVRRILDLAGIAGHSALVLDP